MLRRGHVSCTHVAQRSSCSTGHGHTARAQKDSHTATAHPRRNAATTTTPHQRVHAHARHAQLLRKGGGQYPQEAMTNRKCPHGIQQYFCKPCGGKGICPCGKRKARCRTCNGSSFCPCGKRKSTCRIHCDDQTLGDFCDCLERKHRCQVCGGGSLCHHGRRKDKPCQQCLHEPTQPTDNGGGQ